MAEDNISVNVDLRIKIFNGPQGRTAEVYGHGEEGDAWKLAEFYMNDHTSNIWMATPTTVRSINSEVKNCLLDLVSTYERVRTRKVPDNVVAVKFGER